MHAPPLPQRAATWLLMSLIGRSGVETLWTAVWFHGAMTGAILAAVTIIVVNVLAINVALFTRRP